MGTRPTSPWADSAWISLKNMQLLLGESGLESGSCHVVGSSTSAARFTSQILSVLICKMGIITLPSELLWGSDGTSVGNCLHSVPPCAGIVWVLSQQLGGCLPPRLRFIRLGFAAQIHTECAQPSACRMHHGSPRAHCQGFHAEDDSCGDFAEWPSISISGGRPGSRKQSRVLGSQQREMLTAPGTSPNDRMVSISSGCPAVAGLLCGWWKNPKHLVGRCPWMTWWP